MPATYPHPDVAPDEPEPLARTLPGHAEEGRIVLDVWGPAHQKPYAEYTDALREVLSPEVWAKKLKERVEVGDMRAIEYAGNRLEGLPRHAPDDTAAIAAAQAQAQASALVVVIDGKAVESLEAKRAAAMMMLEKFTQKREPAEGSPGPELRQPPSGP
jgi:hypothetical protein